MFSTESTILLVIDLQEKLAPLMYEKDQIILQVSKLIRFARIMDIPILVTEQVPQKIGRTIPQIVGLIEHIQPILKSSFSCVGNDAFVQRLQASGRQQVVVTGIEAHVCVYQTVRALLEKKFMVEVVSDAISSRRAADKCIALERMKWLGASLTSTEMIICELLKTAEHPKFREVIRLIK